MYGFTRQTLCLNCVVGCVWWWPAICCYRLRVCFSRSKKGAKNWGHMVSAIMLKGWPQPDPKSVLYWCMCVCVDLRFVFFCRFLLLFRSKKQPGAGDTPWSPLCFSKGLTLTWASVCCIGVCVCVDLRFVLFVYIYIYICIYVYIYIYINVYIYIYIYIYICVCVCVCIYIFVIYIY